MPGRSRKTMILTAFGEELEYKTAGGYNVAGAIQYWSDGGVLVRKVVAVGYSPNSVQARARKAFRDAVPRATPDWYPHSVDVGALIEATLPVIRQYFGTHRVAVTGWYVPGTGWLYGHRYAGRSHIVQMAREGVTAVAVSQGLGRGKGRRTADFQMTELVSMRKQAEGRAPVSAATS